MRILFSTGSLYYLPLEDVFHLAKEAGFDGCDLVIDRRFGDADYLETVKACLEILPVCSVHAPFTRVKAWGTQRDALIRSVEIAKILGAQVVNFHPPSWFSLELSFFKWFRGINDFQNAFGAEGIYIAIENMPRIGKRLMLAPYILNNYRALIAFGLTKNLHFTFDITHLGTFGHDPIVAFLRYFTTERLKNIHISDCRAHKSHLFLGRGDLPIAKLLNTMRRMGYDGMVTLEISPDEFPKTREWLVKMMEYQRAFLELHWKLPAPPASGCQTGPGKGHVPVKKDGDV